MKRIIAPAVALSAVLSVVPATADEPTGKALFDHRCGLCHREGGPGTFMLERRLEREPAILEQRGNLGRDYVATVVRRGVGSMPRFSRAEITDAELERLLAYLLDQ